MGVGLGLGLRARLATSAQGLDARLRPGRWYSDTPPDFLVIGLQKCGTYWVTGLLNAHPQVCSLAAYPQAKRGAPEGHLFDGLAMIDTDWPRFAGTFTTGHGGFFRDLVPLARRLPRAKAHQLFRRRYNAYLRANKKPGALYMGDKTTEYVFHLDLVEEFYPGVKKIVILRDPLDRIVSFHHHQIRKGRWSHQSVEDWEAAQYCDRVEAEYRALLAHAGPVHAVTYEALKADTAAVLASMLRHLGADAAPEVVAACVERASFERQAGRKPGQADKASHFRKGVVGEGRRELTEGQRRLARTRLASLGEAVGRRLGLDLSGHLGQD